MPTSQVMAPKKNRTLTEDHKAALVEGRTEGRAVRAYLEALDSHRPKRGRKRTAVSIDRRLVAIDAALATAVALDKLRLVQERLDLQAEADALGAEVDLAALESDFVAHAANYATRKGISHQAWRELGVPAATLKAAGIGRS